MTDGAQPVQYSDDDPVVAQYERWIYPEPVDDLTDPKVAAYVQSYKHIEEPLADLLAGGAVREELDVLVAGCGTMGAACYALLNPKCRVTGIDISRSSLAHEQKLKAHHKLENLTLLQCPIEQVSTLGKEFDFIGCQGVLHHMPEPTAGLAALGQVLRPDGVIAIMLYARYGRTGVYMLQDLFRAIGLEQTPQGVAVVRETLARLPADHPVQNYLRHATDLNNDAGLVDTFLHRRDKCFSAAECASLVGNAGLFFQGWDQNFFYYPEGPFQTAPALVDRINRLPDEKIWEAMDLAFGAIGVHYFHACRRDRDPATFRIPWGLEKLLDCVAIPRAKLVRLQGAGGRQSWAIAEPNRPPFPLSDAGAAIFSHFNGRRSLRDCTAAAGIRETGNALVTLASDFLKTAWRCGFVTVRFPL